MALAGSFTPMETTTSAIGRWEKDKEEVSSWIPTERLTPAFGKTVSLWASEN